MLGRILVVDDLAPSRELIREALDDLGCEISEAPTASDALERLRHREIDLVITDVRMPGMSGVELLRQLHREYPEVVVVLMSAYASISDAVEAMQSGAHHYLSLPLDIDALRSVVERALTNARAGSGPGEQRPGFEKVLGHSRELLAVLDRATRAAKCSSTVLVQGETGTGKELLARGIHVLSARSAKPLVTINCGAIPNELLESELFGHLKGAFTGAFADRRGQVEAANGGTLFMDEIGEMQPQLQVKLLRLLQDGEIQKLGSVCTTKVDVRVIAATHRDLAAMVHTGKFREDLFYRINVIPLKLPPLRERRDDIPELLRFFFGHCCAKHGRQDLKLTDEVVDRFRAYRWPGNIRELENVVERIVVLAGPGELHVPDLPEFLQPEPNPVEAIQLNLPQKGICFGGLEKEVLLQALQQCNWNQSMAARYLGMTRKTLVYRIQKYDLLKFARLRATPDSTHVM